MVKTLKKLGILLLSCTVIILVLFLKETIKSYQKKSIPEGKYYIDIEGNIVNGPYDRFNVSIFDFDKNGIARISEKYDDTFWNDEVYFVDKDFNVIDDHRFRNGDLTQGVYRGEDIFICRYAREIIILNQRMDVLLRMDYDFPKDMKTLMHIIKAPGENGLFPIKDQATSLWGYMDISGAMVIEPQFSYAYPFSEDGLAIVKNPDNLYGAIDEKGNIVIDYQFTRMTNFSNGVALAGISDEDKGVFINSEGKAVSDNVFFQDSLYQDDLKFVDGYARVKDYETGLYGYVNNSGEYVIDPQYKSAYDFSNGYAAVQNSDGLYGFITTKGLAIDYQFEDVRNFTDEGVAAVELNGKWGYITTENEWLFEPQFIGAFNFSNGYAAVILEEGRKPKKLKQ